MTTWSPASSPRGSILITYLAPRAIGDFVVTTDTRMMERPLLPGRSYDYPLTLLSNQGYKGTVGLSVKAYPGLDGMQASFAPASMALDGLAESKFSLASRQRAFHSPSPGGEGS